MKHYSTANYDPTTSVGFAITRARNIVVTEMDAALRDLEITTTQMGIILSMSRGLASTPFELSKLLETDTGLMTRMLDKLEQQGLLTRVRSTDDRRMVNLALTARGRQVAEDVPARAPAVLNHRLRDFTAAEFKEFHRLLSKFIAA